MSRARDALALPHGTPAGDLEATLARLPEAARIGTGSVRRASQLKGVLAQAAFLPVRGNVDTRVRKLDATYPNYGFSSHVGYATRTHWEALREHGPCDIHRKSFKGVMPDENRGSDEFMLT